MSGDTRRFLNSAYGLRSAGETRRHYDDWAASYNAELAENGYATPARAAAALARVAPDRAAPVLDIGCGTGLSSLALRAEGFSTIDGTDLSAEMLERARALGGSTAIFFWATQTTRCPSPLAPMPTWPRSA